MALLGAAIAYYVLTMVLIAHHGGESKLALAIGRDTKGKISLVCYAVAVPLAFVQPWLSCAIYVVVAVLWLVPDQRIERKIVDSAA